MSGPARGRRRRVTLLRAALPCLALIAFDRRRRRRPRRSPPTCSAPVRDGFVRRRIHRCAGSATTTGDDRAIPPTMRRLARQGRARAVADRQDSRHTACRPPAAPPTTGFDSLNRTRKKPKFYPGQAKPKPLAGPGTPAPASAKRADRFERARAAVDSAVRDRQQAADRAGDGRHRRWASRARKRLHGRRRSVRRGRRLRRQLPDQVRGRTFAAATTPIPAAPSMPQGIAVLGGGAGISGGLRLGSPCAGRRLARLVHRLWQQPVRRSSTARSRRRRPISTGRISPAMSTAASMSRTTPTSPREVRLRVATDNPGSPNVAGRACQISGLCDLRRHLRHRPAIQPAGCCGRRHHRPHRLSRTPSSPTARSTSNDDRDFNQYGGVGRVSYDLLPGVKPFVEVEGDSRVHDQQLDHSGYRAQFHRRLCQGRHLVRILPASRPAKSRSAMPSATMSIRGLASSQGLLTSSSLTWTATPLTTAKFYSTTSIDETIVPGVSGVLTPHLYVRGRSRFPPLADGDRQIHLRHLRLPGRRPLRQNLLARRRSDLQDDPQLLDQGHAAARHPRFQRAAGKFGLDRGDAGRAGAELRSSVSYPADAGYPARCGLAMKHRHLWNTGSPAFAGDDDLSVCKDSYRGRPVDPIRKVSIARAHSRPSRIAQTTSDCPRRMSPAENTFDSEVW